MTRDELIERLARTCHMQLEYEDDCEFDASTDEHQADMREFGASLIPAVVEFVAEWLERHSDGTDPDRMAVRWREEMGQ